MDVSQCQPDLWMNDNKMNCFTEASEYLKSVVEIIIIFFINDDRGNCTANLFNERLPDKLVGKRVFALILVQKISSNWFSSQQETPHKIHQLNEDDFNREQVFWQVMTTRIEADKNFLFHICFSDEPTFFLNSIVNRHNWNSHVFHEVHTETPREISVSTGIFEDLMIESVSLDG